MPLAGYLYICVRVCLHMNLSPIPSPLLRGSWKLIPGVVFCSVPILVLMFPPASASRPPSWMAFLGTVPWTPHAQSPKTQLISCPSRLPFSGQHWATRHGRRSHHSPTLCHSLLFTLSTSGPAHNLLFLVEEVSSLLPAIPGLSRLVPAAHSTPTASLAHTAPST